jgi:hypothetical protein
MSRPSYQILKTIFPTIGENTGRFRGGDWRGETLVHTEENRRRKNPQMIDLIRGEGEGGVRSSYSLLCGPSLLSLS